MRTTHGPLTQVENIFYMRAPLDTQRLAETAFREVDTDCVHRIDCEQNVSVHIDELYKSSFDLLDHLGRRSGYCFGDYRLHVETPHDIASVTWNVNGDLITVLDTYVPEDQWLNVWSRSGHGLWVLPIDPFVSRVWSRPVLTSVLLQIRTASPVRLTIHFRLFQFQADAFEQLLVRHGIDCEDTSPLANVRMEHYELHLIKIPLRYTTRGVEPAVHYTAYDGIIAPGIAPDRRFALAQYNGAGYGPFDPSRLLCAFRAPPQHRTAILLALAPFVAHDADAIFYGRVRCDRQVIRTETRDQVQNCLETLGGEVVDFLEIYFERPTAEQVRAARLKYEKELSRQEALYNFLQTGTVTIAQ